MKNEIKYNNMVDINSTFISLGTASGHSSLETATSSGLLGIRKCKYIFYILYLIIFLLTFISEIAKNNFEALETKY